MTKRGIEINQNRPTENKAPMNSMDHMMIKPLKIFRLGVLISKGYSGMVNKTEAQRLPVFESDIFTSSKIYAL